jgi:hypothetical protein
MSKKISEIVSEQLTKPVELSEKLNEIAASPDFVIDGAVPVAEVDLSKFPVLVSLGITKTSDGWVMFQLTTQNDKVISVVYSQADLRSVCIDNFKITAHKLFMEII